MKYSIFDSRNDKYIKYDRDNVCDIRIVLFRHPVEDMEAATKGYLDKKASDIKAENISGILRHDNIPRFIGEDITTPNEKTLLLRQIHSGVKLGAVVETDAKGRIINVHPITDEYLDPNLKISWNNIIEEPNTLEGYGITDLVRSNAPDVIKSDTIVRNYRGMASKGPMPIEYLEVKFEEVRRAQLPIGSQIIKLDGTDSTNALVTNGATIQASRFPELVLALTKDPKATSAKLPDNTKDDEIRFYRTGVKAKTYIIF